MAIVVQETINATSGSATSVTATSFSGLTVGDLMVSQFFVGALGTTITMPAGWTQIVYTENAGTTIASQIAYKIADAGDVSGNSFQFSKGAGAVVLYLFINRITGHRTTSTITASSGQANDGTVTVTAPTVTPIEAGSMIMLFATSTESTSISGYTIATSPPSFTELYDNNSNGRTISAAYGVRPEVTATGSGTATTANSGDNIGQMIVVSAPQIFTILDTVTGTDTFLGGIGLLILDIITATDSITSAIARLWTNLTRNIKTWTNRDR